MKKGFQQTQLDMFQLLQPVLIDSPKVRLGQKQDGGYVINEIAIDKSFCLYTYGVGGDVGFETDYYNRTKNPVFLFDPTVDMPNVPEGMSFRKEGLGDGTTHKLFSDHHFDSHKLNRVLLKIDTEGAEYDYFMAENIDYLGEWCTGIILEIHHLNEAMRQLIFKRILRDLQKDFFLTHIHGNNWGGEFGYQGYSVPNVMELSFVNRDICNGIVGEKVVYPIPGLDYPNRPDQPDCRLLFLNKKS